SASISFPSLLLRAPRSPLFPYTTLFRSSVFDLAIMMAAWGADYAVQAETGPVFLAALGLDGSLQSAPGILPAVMAAVDAGYTDIVVAKYSDVEVLLVPVANVIANQLLVT